MKLEVTPEIRVRLAKEGFEALETSYEVPDREYQFAFESWAHSENPHLEAAMWCLTHPNHGPLFLPEKIEENTGQSPSADTAAFLKANRAIVSTHESLREMAEKHYPALRADFADVKASGSIQANCAKMLNGHFVRFTERQHLLGLQLRADSVALLNAVVSGQVEALTAAQGETDKLLKAARDFGKMIFWGLLAIISILAALTFFAARAHAQRGTSRIDVITFQDSGGSNVKTFAAPFKIKCSTNMTCTASGSTLTMVSAAGSGGSPGGSDTQIQFNDATAFGGIAGMTYIKASTLVKMQAGTKFSLTDTGDLTKAAQFDLSGISTATTRTFILPNANGTFCLLSTCINTLSVTAPITSTGGQTPSIGMVNQGTTTTVLHGNGAGNPSFGAIVQADVTNGYVDLSSAQASIAGAKTFTGAVGLTAGGSLGGTFTDSGPSSTISNSPTGATESTNTVTITTTAPCTFTTGMVVNISGVTNTSYNGNYVVLTPGCNGGSTFTYINPLGSLAASGSGTVLGSPKVSGNISVTGLTVTGTGAPVSQTAATNLANLCGTAAAPITTFATFGYTPCIENSEYFAAPYSFQGYAGVVHRNDMVTVQTAAGSDIQSAVTVINAATCNGTNTSGQTNDNGTTCSAELTTAVGNNSGSVVAADIVGQSGFTGNGSKLVQANQQLVNCARAPGFNGDVTHDYCALQTNNIQGGSQGITTYLGNDTSQAGVGALIGEWVASTTSAAHATLHGQVQPKYGYVNAASSIASYYSGAEPNIFLMNQGNMSTYSADNPFYSLISGEKAANSGQSQVLAFDSTPAGTSATIAASPTGAIQASSSIVTFTTTAVHGFTAPNASGPTQVAHITGVTNTGYNIDCPIQSVPTTTTFTCYDSNITGSSFTISTISETASTVTVTTSAVCDFATGQIVTVKNVGSNPSTAALMPYDGAWTVLAPGCNGGSTFTYTDTTSGLGSSSGGTVVGGWLSPSGAGTVTASNIARWTIYNGSDQVLRFGYQSPQSGNGTQQFLFDSTATLTLANLLASGVVRGTHQTNSANLAGGGQYRAASGDTFCWRNNANGADICISKTGAVSGIIPADALDLTQFGGVRHPATTATVAPIQIIAQLNAPAVPVLACSNSGGSLAAATHFFKIAFNNTTAGVTTVSPEASCATTGTTGSVVVTAPTLPTNATGYTVYDSNTTNTELTQAASGACVNISANCTVTTLAAGAAMPSANNASACPTAHTALFGEEYCLSSDGTTPNNIEAHTPAPGTAGAILTYDSGGTNAITDTVNGTITSYTNRRPLAAGTGVQFGVNASNVITQDFSGDAAHALSQTAKTAAVTTFTLCAATAGTACGQVGQYRISYNFWGSGTACSAVTAGSVGLNLTWTDENAVAHTTISVPMWDQKSAANGILFNFNTALGTEGASGSYIISTNGTIIQAATTYTACTTGTGTYNLRMTVEQLQ